MRLEEAGWAKQTNRSDEDGRLKFFRITGKGAKAKTAFEEELRAGLALSDLAAGGAA